LLAAGGLAQGTYTNPILHADYSDPDLIRVGGDFYMISSSFNHVPGLPVLHSRDLIHWELIGHALPRLPAPAYDRPQHGRGVWAPSIRYHAGEYWIYYGDPDLGPEHSSSVALSVAGNAGRFGRLAVSATQYYVSDLIGTTATTDPAYTWGIKAANLERARITSHQISLSELKLAGFSIAADFMLLDRARLESTRTQIPGIAARQATAVVERKIGPTTWTCRGQWWGSVWENAENTRSAPASHDISLFLRHNFKECSFEAGLLNLTDASQQRVVGYTRPGRRLTLALEALF